MSQYWHVWMEGYQATGERGEARKLGMIWAQSFPVACEIAADYNGFKALYNRKTNRIWGCRLFDNEADARKEYG
jgi:hypothetical protein